MGVVYRTVLAQSTGLGLIAIFPLLLRIAGGLARNCVLALFLSKSEVVSRCCFSPSWAVNAVAHDHQKQV